MSFAENLKKLPRTSHLAAINLVDLEGNLLACIENKPGSQGSLSVYNHLGQTFGAINADAARKGIELFAEHTEEARMHPGKHPNIDRLFEIIREDRVVRIKHVFEYYATSLNKKPVGKVKSTTEPI